MKYSTCLGALVTGGLLLAGGGARASTPTTCTYTTGTDSIAQVQVDGRNTTIDVSPAGILVNGMFCGEPTQVDRINVVGGALADRVTLSGQFVPGFTYESSFDEIEVFVDLGDGNDTLTLSLGDGSDRCVDVRSVDFVGQPYLNCDNDADVNFRFVETLKLWGNGGNDQILTDIYQGPAVVEIDGGPGDDYITGTERADQIDGGDGNDTLVGFGGDDVLIGGSGSDIFRGDAGVDTADYRARTAPVTVTIGNGVADDGEAGEQDRVNADVERVLGGKGNDVLVGSANGEALEGGGGNDLLDGGAGGDFLSGGPGNDTVDYGSRTAAVTVTMGNAFPDDGEDIEGDLVDATVENVTGGAGNDTLIGTAAVNVLHGGPGNDTLQGEGGNDTLYGDAGDDALVGGAGADRLYGAAGSDVLDGGPDADTFTAGGGNDFLYNDDGVAETVNCGAGTDDAEVDTGAVNTFIGCEL